MELDRLGNIHVCHANGCVLPVPRRMFMCKTHWYRLPKAMRDAIWQAYRPGQETGRVEPSAEYLRVATEAINWLAQQESE